MLLLLLVLFVCVPLAVVLVFVMAFIGGVWQIVAEILRQIHEDVFGGRR